jgi:hypothetical protein
MGDSPISAGENPESTLWLGEENRPHFNAGLGRMNPRGAGTNFWKSVDSAVNIP